MTVTLPIESESKSIRVTNRYATGCIVLLTGPVDYLSDGSRTIAIRNGNELLGQITGVSYSSTYFVMTIT